MALETPRTLQIKEELAELFSGSRRATAAAQSRPEEALPSGPSSPSARQRRVAQSQSRQNAPNKTLFVRQTRPVAPGVTLSRATSTPTGPQLGLHESIWDVAAPAPLLGRQHCPAVTAPESTALVVGRSDDGWGDDGVDDVSGGEEEDFSDRRSPPPLPLRLTVMTRKDENSPFDHRREVDSY